MHASVPYSIIVAIAEVFIVCCLYVVCWHSIIVAIADLLFVICYVL